VGVGVGGWGGGGGGGGCGGGGGGVGGGGWGGGGGGGRCVSWSCFCVGEGIGGGTHARLRGMACLLASFWLFLVGPGVLLASPRVLRSRLLNGLSFARLRSSSASRFFSICTPGVCGIGCWRPLPGFAFTSDACSGVVAETSAFSTLIWEP